MSDQPAPDRIESDREAIYRRLYAAWPEARSALGVMDDVPAQWTATEYGNFRAALDSLCADGRVEQVPHGYRVRMGAS